MIEFGEIIYNKKEIKKIKKIDPLFNKDGINIYETDGPGIMLEFYPDPKYKKVKNISNYDIECFDSAELRDKRFDEIKQKLGA